MNTRRAIRQLALQVLYQFDCRGEGDLEQIAATLDEAPGEPAEKAEAMKLARAAWSTREEADALAGELATNWPTTRQPVIDRCLFRLAYHEMTTGRAPAAVVIDEAVELAKTFGGERSPSFVNGVLDRMMRRLRDADRLPDAPPSGPASDPDTWLADAVDDDPRRTPGG